MAKVDFVIRGGTIADGSGGPLRETDVAIDGGKIVGIGKIAESGREEVEVSRIAAERATNPDVKKFAQMMVDDHTRANEELESLASAKGVKLKDKEKSENKWSKKDAQDFDRDYVKKMVSDHKKDIDLFSKESKNGTDAELTEFARKTLPTLNKHLETVSELEKTVK